MQLERRIAWPRLALTAPEDADPCMSALSVSTQYYLVHKSSRGSGMLHELLQGCMSATATVRAN